MRIKIGIIILAAVCVGLAIALFATKKTADDRQATDAAAILDFSNQLVAANTSLNDLRQVNLVLTNDLEVARQATDALSNSLAEAASTLADTRSTLQNAEGQITNLNARIADLEDQNKTLDTRAATLADNIAALDAQIAAIQQKLATSETNNTFLIAELKKQLAEKADLQRKFNDIDVVRAQVKKLRDELFVARRLQWMNSGSDPSNPPKGGQVLMQRTAAVTVTNAAPAHPPQYDLNVEIGSDGSVHVIPAPAPTNPPSH
jgi:chromosome segregation ATPase